MAKTKKCSSCNELKPTTKFSKYKSSKDLLQPHCKECQITRTNKLLKANKDGIIYTITNPLGQTYCGQTNMNPKYRWSMHKSFFKTNCGAYPLLHQSFTLWGVDAHEFKVINNLGNISKSELREVETRIIIALKNNGKCLNINE